MCKVSVIIPVYNAQKTLRKSVESLIYGRLKDIEIILVDDCSKDESWELCKSLAYEYAQVKCIQNAKNSGPSFTRNQGLLESRGEYISFVDSDDWVSGEFLSILYETANQNKGSVVTCGFAFVNQLSAETVNYVWEKQENQSKIYTIAGIKLFDAIDKIMLQNIWNKLFLREAIIRCNIRFDETQMMGEDFQFVLDYMQAMQISRCKVINRPLYYYVRANNSSLMSNFGLSGFNESKHRLEQLTLISGDDSLLEKFVTNLRRNYFYQIAKNKKLNRKEKKNLVNSLTSCKADEKFYYQCKRDVWIEKIYDCKKYVNTFIKRIQGRMQRIKRERVICDVRKQINNQNFSIISQNCIGGVFYHDLNMRFLSPTVNLYFTAADFVKFAVNLEKYINMELHMCWRETYPIGHLGDIEIRFMHYNTCTEAYNSWEKRKKRINFDKILVLATDREAFNVDVLSEWKKIRYPKLLFTANKDLASQVTSVYYEKYSNDHMVIDLIPNREFYKNGTLIKMINSL